MPIIWIALQTIQHVLLFALGFIAFYCALMLLPRRRRRLALPLLRETGLMAPPSPLLARLLAVGGGGERLAEREQLLAGAGIRMHPLRYAAYRRIALLTLCAGGAVLYAAARYGGGGTYQTLQLYGWLAVTALMLVLLGDRFVLEAIRRQRSRRIVKEIYVLSHQLLYYNGSRLSLHGKLMRCLPFTRTIRADMALMLNEWYQDAERAIRSFKRRLGTDEAFSFGETLDALRQNEAEAYYELLRQRIQDYKAKLDMLKESRKETTSYALFVIAGIPIMNTFRLFIYPWVQEGQKLFHSLN